MEGKRRGRKKRVRDNMGGIWMARWHRMDGKGRMERDSMGREQNGKGQDGKRQDEKKQDGK